jgi:ribosomal-protein-alanine N-acetyltransferase
VPRPIVDDIFRDPVFETERLFCGRWHPDLAEPAFAIYGDPDVTQWIGGVTEDSIETMRARIESLIERNSSWPAHWGSWPTFLKDTRELVGAMLMKPLPDADGNCTPDIEIGWHLGRAHWGNGYATEGGRRMIEIAFHELGIRELSAVTAPDNVRSQSVARRLGMMHVGQTDAYYGQTVELFKIINSEQ